jgi:hypothetical protein
MQVQMQPVAEEDRANLGVGDFEPSRNPTGRSASYDEPHGMAVVHLGRPGCFPHWERDQDRVPRWHDSSGHPGI